MLALRRLMDVGVVASTNEAFGRTTIEGMLSMMAMVGRNSGGTPEQIRNLETGLLYNGSVLELTECLRKLYLDRTLLKKLAIAGFNESVALHTKGRCAKIAEIAIDECL